MGAVLCLGEAACGGWGFFSATPLRRSLRLLYAGRRGLHVILTFLEIGFGQRDSFREVCFVDAVYLLIGAGFFVLTSLVVERAFERVKP